MTLIKQAVNIDFSLGLDTKTDEFQLAIGNFLKLKNSVFTKGKRLTKRNGFGSLPALPDPASFGTTFNGDLTAIGSDLQAYSSSTQQWVNKGTIIPADLSVLPLVRNNLNQLQADCVISSTGLVCTAYAETPDNSALAFKYVIADAATGQNITAPALLPNATATSANPRVFLMDRHFVIVYAGTSSSLKFLAISISNPTTTVAGQISNSYTPGTTTAMDGVVFNGSLYLAWNGASASGIKMAFLAPNLSVSATVTRDASHVATLMSVCADVDSSVIWASYFDSATGNAYCLAVDPALVLQANFPAQVLSSSTATNLASAAFNGLLRLIHEVPHTDNGVAAHFLDSANIILSTGTVIQLGAHFRGVGLASKAFLLNKNFIYFFVTYQSAYQSTYFLVEASGEIIAKFAYENGAGYLTRGLPSVTVSGNTVHTAYLLKDLIQAVNKNTNIPAGNQTVGVYSQQGINLVTTSVATVPNSAEIGSNLNLTGGFLWGYDGFQATEQGFFLYPEPVQVTTAAGSGSITADDYFYVATYEWTDNQGNAFRSAPSIPVPITTTTSSSTNTAIVPTLRLTYKTVNPVKIVLYRWSSTNQVYYQVTSITAPILNSTSVDSVTITDAASDATIQGNNILYTTGGVLENIGAPAASAVTLFDDRLWLIDAEDRNLLWFSKQVIEATPVEMSDLLTIYVAPTIGSQGPTGPMKALSTMDDKLIILKKDALYYINGTGPDNTGANNQYSQPTFITSMVGCSNQASIVFQPHGLMFEYASEAGNQIWLLGRDLSTQYIGSPVEELTKGATVLSAIAVPGTNQVRFNMSSGETLMYDYFFGQWGDFSTNAVSSTLYQGLHTEIDSFGRVFQESPNQYLDGSSPVLLSLKTAWINLAGIQGYERAYFFYLLGRYFSPFKLVCSIAYDYNPSPLHQAIIAPTNFAPNYGAPQGNGQVVVYGEGGPYGGPGNVLNWRVFLKKQHCSAFQITIEEVYDPSFGVAAGQGLSLSGINLVCAIKKGFHPISSKHSVGAS